MLNKAIGSRIKKLRTALKISQMKLAETVGVSFQQIQKYESGANRVSLEKLKKISKALNVPFQYLAGREEDSIGGATGVSEEPMRLGFDDLSTEEIQLVFRYRAVKNESIRKGMLLLFKGIETMANE